MDKSFGISYCAHVQNKGWMDYVSEDKIAGTTGIAHRLEAFKIKLSNCPVLGAKLKYRVSVPGKGGWQDYVTDDQIAGTTGESQLVEAVTIELENAPGWSIVYRVHLENIGWTEWVRNGTTAGTIGESLRLEAIQVHVVRDAAKETPADVYINGLSYDASKVLVDNSNVPLYKKEDGKIEENATFIVIKKKECTVSNNNADLVYIDALASRLYPGTMVLCNSKLIENNPDIVALNTNRVGFVIDLPGTDQQFHVEQLGKGAVEQAIQSKISDWKRENPQGVIAARIKQNVYEVKTQHQIEASLGFKLSSAKQNLNIDFNAVESGKSREWILQYQQIYYTVALDDFRNPSDIIADSVTIDDLKKKNINNSNPIGIVNHVSYGRIIYVHFKTENAALDISGSINLVIKGEKNLDATAKAKYNMMKDVTSTDVFIYGGGTSAFSAMPSIGMDGITDFIAQGYNFNSQQVAVPIGYSVVFMKNGGQELAKVNSTSTYIETTYTRYSSSQLRLYQGGAFVNRYTITWNEIGYDANGNVTVTPKSWERNGKDTCAGQKFDIFLKGNARNLHINSKGCTGIVWDKTRTNFDRDVTITPIMEFDVGGTTLNQKSWFHEYLSH
jgi:thiol-activated cytolysin